MTNTSGESTALNADTQPQETQQEVVQTPETPSTEETQTPETPKEPAKDGNKDFYKIFGQMKKYEKMALENAKTIQEQNQIIEEMKSRFSQDEDYQGYSPEQVSFVDQRIQKTAEKIAERKFMELQENARKSDLQQKEEQSFVSHNPEAIEYLDKIYAFRQSFDPDISLSAAWKVMKPMYYEEDKTPSPPRPVMNMGGNGSVSETPKSLDTNVEEGAYWREALGMK